MAYRYQVFQAKLNQKFLLNWSLSEEGLLVSLCSLLDVELLLELLLSCEATEWDSLGFELDEDEDGGGGFAGMLWDTWDF